MSGFPNGNATAFLGKRLLAATPNNGDCWVYNSANGDYELAPNGAGGGASVNDPYVVNGTAADLPNAQQLASVLGAGTLAARPAAAVANASWYYFATDTAQWYQSNGTTWTARTPLGTDTSKLAIANNLSDVASRQSALDTLALVGNAQQVLGSDGTHVGMRARPLAIVGQGAAVSNTAVATTMFASALTIPQNTIAVGDYWRIWAGGSLLQNGATGTTYTFTVKIGSRTIYSTIGASFAQNASTRNWFLVVELVIVNPGWKGVAYSNIGPTTSTQWGTTTSTDLQVASSANDLVADNAAGALAPDVLVTMSQAQAATSITMTGAGFIQVPV